MNVTPTLSSTQTLTLRKALLVYDAGTGTNVFNQHAIPETALVTIHDILLADANEDKGGAPELLPGRLLDRATFAELWRNLSGLSRTREILSPNILFHDAGRMVWHVPAVRRPIWFSERYAGLNKTIKDIKSSLNGKEVLWPPLLFVAEPGHLYAWALGSDGRPTADTPLYVAPVLNLYDTGHMCRGNVRLPDAMNMRDLSTWEHAFYGTEFTHSNYRSQVICRHPKGHDALWREMVWRQTFRGFPERYLSPAKSGTASATGIAKTTGKGKGDKVLTVGEVING